MNSASELRALRRSAKLSQAQAGALVGISQAAWSGYESGSLPLSEARFQELRAVLEAMKSAPADDAAPLPKDPERAFLLGVLRSAQRHHASLGEDLARAIGAVLRGTPVVGAQALTGEAAEIARDIPELLEPELPVATPAKRRTKRA